MDRVDQRERILRRLRRYLEQQREQFQRYLQILEQEQAVIRAGDVDRLQYHVELEQMVIAGIQSFQRAIDPLEELYRHAYPGQEPSIVGLKSRLQELREQALARNEENRRLLQDRLESLRLEMKDLRRRGQRPLSPYARLGEPKLVDIRS